MSGGGHPPRDWTRRGLFALGAASATGLALAAPPASAAEPALDAGIVPGPLKTALSPAEQAAIDAISLVATPARFPGLDPTGGSNSATALQAAITATPEHGTLLIPPGSYRIDNSVTNAGKNITILGYGATLIKAANTARVLQLNGSYDDPIAVSSITPTVLTGTSLDQNGIAVALGSAPNWQPGEIVKLVAENVITGARPGSGGNESRVGQYFVVHSMSGSTANLIGSPREAFTTGVRAARLRETRVRVAGFTFTTTAAGMSAGWTGEMCSFSALIRPAIRDVEVIQAPGPALVFRGCYGYEVQNVSVDSAIDDGENGAFGYGILDNSSAYGRISNFYARKVRHAYTDDSARIPTGSSVSLYGATYGTRITDSVCQGSTSTAWDTHSCSEGVTFSGCQAIECARGFSLRGRKHAILDSVMVGCREGARIATEGTGVDKSWGHLIDGLRADGITLTALAVEPYLGGGTARETRPSIVRRFSVVNSPSPQLTANNVVVEFHDLRLELPASVANNSAAIRFNNAEVRGSGWTLDLRQNTAGTGIQLASLRNGGSFDLEGMVVEWLPGTEARMDTVFASDRTVPSEIGNVLLPVRITSPSRDLFFGSTFSWRSGSDHSGFIERLNDNISTASAAGAISRSADRTVFVNCRTNATRSFAALLDGALLGQLLIIANSELSTGNVNVRQGAEFNVLLASTGTKALAPGRSVTLIWSGSIWREA